MRGLWPWYYTPDGWDWAAVVSFIIVLYLLLAAIYGGAIVFLTILVQAIRGLLVSCKDDKRRGYKQVSILFLDEKMEVADSYIASSLHAYEELKQIVTQDFEGKLVYDVSYTPEDQRKKRKTNDSTVFVYALGDGSHCVIELLK